MKMPRFAFVSVLLGAGLLASSAGAAVNETLSLETQTQGAMTQGARQQLAVDDVTLGAPGPDGKLSYTPPAMRSRATKYSVVRVRLSPGTAAQTLENDQREHKLFQKAVVKIAHTGADGKEQLLYEYDLENAIVTNLEKSSFDGKTVVFATLTYAKITVKTGGTGGSTTTTDTWTSQT